AGPESSLIRGYHATRTGGSIDIATTRGRNSSGCIRRLGPLPLFYRVVWRDVLRGVAEDARAGVAYGSRRYPIPPVAAGDVAGTRLVRTANVAGQKGGGW